MKERLFRQFPTLAIGIVLSALLCQSLVAREANTPLPGRESITLVRGPYLQIGTPAGIVIRWRTESASDSRVRFGIDPNHLEQFVDEATVTTEHEMTLTGLQPSTRYYYAVGDGADHLVAGSEQYFITAPPDGTRKKTRIWVLGDSGTADSNAESVRDAYEAFTGSRHTDLWVMLGDNAYDNGTDSEYQRAVFEMYPRMLCKSVLWPAFGNHDGQSANSENQSGVFYDIFTLPTRGEAGGVASNTEAYYSFNFANIHFVCLNSHDVSRETAGPMLTWVKKDLAANQLDWTIAFWHHPPYSKGSHDSDSESHLTEMRENALPILEEGGVDLVLSGHSHSYERSYLIDGHYDKLHTLTDDMILDHGDGREDGDGAYQKSVSGPAPHEGTVYVVAGSSGKTSSGDLDHPVMFVSYKVLGSAILDIDHNRMDLIFLDNDGNRLDYFTMLKGDRIVGITPPIVRFSGRKSKEAVILSWTAGRDAGLTGFQIHRATDKSGPYERIGSYRDDPALRAAGNGAASRAYQFVDDDLISGAVYWYKLESVGPGSEQSFYGPISVELELGPAVRQAGRIPEHLTLYQNYPNPFNPSTTFRFDLPANRGEFYELRLEIFDIRGKRVKTLVRGKYAPGSYTVHWDGKSDQGSSSASGIYLYRLKANEAVLSGKLTILQ